MERSACVFLALPDGGPDGGPIAGASPLAGDAVLVVRRPMTFVGPSSGAVLALGLRGVEVARWRDIGGEDLVPGMSSFKFGQRGFLARAAARDQYAARDVFQANHVLLRWQPNAGSGARSADPATAVPLNSAADANSSDGSHGGKRATSASTDPLRYRVLGSERAAAAGPGAVFGRNGAPLKPEEDGGEHVCRIEPGTYRVPFILPAFPINLPGSFEDEDAVVVVAEDAPEGGFHRAHSKIVKLPATLVSESSRPLVPGLTTSYHMVADSLQPKDLGPRHMRSRIRYEATLFLGTEEEMPTTPLQDRPATETNDQNTEQAQSSSAVVASQSPAYYYSLLHFQKHFIALLSAPMSAVADENRRRLAALVSTVSGSTESSFLMGGDPVRLQVTLPRGAVGVAGETLPVRIAVDNRSKNRSIQRFRITLFKVITLQTEQTSSDSANAPGARFEREIAIAGADLGLDKVLPGSRWQGLVKFNLPAHLPPNVHGSYIDQRYDLTVSCEASLTAQDMFVRFRNVIVLDPRVVRAFPLIRTALDGGLSATRKDQSNPNAAPAVAVLPSNGNLEVDDIQVKAVQHADHGADEVAVGDDEDDSSGGDDYGAL